ncbi:MAG TPA: histidine kinase dimerization/phospho-acceptor domain-containing protein [Terriglobales bacterium]|nr:histidine kinase dimerization/phospho-acceptor domain-containing protein [Terriglobales bacterium]
MQESDNKAQIVLIVAGDESQALALQGRWSSDAAAPQFVVASASRAAAQAVKCDLAVVAGLAGERLDLLLQALSRIAKLSVVCFAESAQTREYGAPTIVLQQHEDWIDTAVVLGREILRRQRLAEMARRAEEAAAASLGHATVGRYVLEMRHNVNNALTSVLGNAELLLMGEALAPEVRAQVEIIHSMTMRMHEIMRRLASLASEMRFATAPSQSETRFPPEERRSRRLRHSA